MGASAKAKEAIRDVLAKGVKDVAQIIAEASASLGGGDANHALVGRVWSEHFDIKGAV